MAQYNSNFRYLMLKYSYGRQLFGKKCKVAIIINTFWFNLIGCFNSLQFQVHLVENLWYSAVSNNWETVKRKQMNLGKKLYCFLKYFPSTFKQFCVNPDQYLKQFILFRCHNFFRLFTFIIAVLSFLIYFPPLSLQTYTRAFVSLGTDLPLGIKRSHKEWDQVNVVDRVTQKICTCQKTSLRLFDVDRHDSLLKISPLVCQPIASLSSSSPSKDIRIFLWYS